MTPHVTRRTADSILEQTRGPLNIAAAASLMMCVAVCVLWVWSHFIAVEVSICEGDFRAGNPWTIALGNGRGVLWVRRYRVFGDGAEARVFVQRTVRKEFHGEPQAAGIFMEDAPVDRGRSPKSKGYRWHVRLPHWVLALMLLAPPLLWMARCLTMREPGHRSGYNPRVPRAGSLSH